MKNFLILFVAVLFCSCGITKRISNKKETIKQDSAAKVETSLQVIESLDTNIVTPETKTGFDIVEGDTEEQVIETPELKIVIQPTKPGSKKRAVHVTKKRAVVPIKFNRVTNTKTKSSIKTHRDESTKTKEVDKKTGFVFPWWIWPIIFFIVLAYLIYKFPKLRL